MKHHSDDRATTTGSRFLLPVSPIRKVSFGRYKLVGKLGHGRIAELLLGVEKGREQGGTLYVIKRLHHHLEADEELIRVFLDEARIASTLKHRNVVRTFDVSEVEKSHFFAMEYLEGQGLDRILRRCLHRGVKLPPALAVALIAEVLEGLNYAHDHKGADGSAPNVVHRDIRPHNVFVTYDGAVKILDFGIAKATTKEVETRSGAVKGKIGYIAPEQARGEEIDRRADLWSCGVVLWEALTERRLFGDVDGISSILKDEKAIRERVETLTDHAQFLPEALVSAVTKALRRDRGWRYQTASEMKSDLLAAVPGAASRSILHQLKDFVQELFADTVPGHREAVKICLENKGAIPEHLGDFKSMVRASSDSVSISGLPRGTLSFDAPKIKERRTRVERIAMIVLAVLVIFILSIAVGYRLAAPSGEGEGQEAVEQDNASSP